MWQDEVSNLDLLDQNPVERGKLEGKRKGKKKRKKGEEEDKIEDPTSL